MIGGMGGIFKDATYGQSVQDLSNNPEPVSGTARVAGDVARVVVSTKTGSVILGELAGRATESVVNEMTKSSNGGADLSRASFPKQ